MYYAQHNCISMVCSVQQTKLRSLRSKELCQIFEEFPNTRQFLNLFCAQLSQTFTKRDKTFGQVCCCILHCTVLQIYMHRKSFFKKNPQFTKFQIFFFNKIGFKSWGELNFYVYQFTLEKDSVHIYLQYSVCMQMQLRVFKYVQEKPCINFLLHFHFSFLYFNHMYYIF